MVTVVVAVIIVWCYITVCHLAYSQVSRWQDCAAKYGPDHCDHWGRYRDIP